jgi:hypothetical protein
MPIALGGEAVSGSEGTCEMKVEIGGHLIGVDSAKVRLLFSAANYR